MKEDTKGLYLAIILSLVIIFVTNMIFPSSPTPRKPEFCFFLD